jgi:hypothetical protein
VARRTISEGASSIAPDGSSTRLGRFSENLVSPDRVPERPSRMYIGGGVILLILIILLVLFLVRR